MEKKHPIELKLMQKDILMITFTFNECVVNLDLPKFPQPVIMFYRLPQLFYRSPQLFVFSLRW